MTSARYKEAEKRAREAAKRAVAKKRSYWEEEARNRKIVMEMSRRVDLELATEEIFRECPICGDLASNVKSRQAHGAKFTHWYATPPVVVCCLNCVHDFESRVIRIEDLGDPGSIKVVGRLQFVTLDDNPDFLREEDSPQKRIDRLAKAATVKIRPSKNGETVESPETMLRKILGR